MNPSSQLDEHVHPVLATRQLVLFPAMRCRVHIASDRARSAIEAALERNDRFIAVLTSFADSVAEPAPSHLAAIGTVARVSNFDWTSCCRRWVVNVEGVARIRTTSWLRQEPFREARCVHLVDSVADASLYGLVSAIHDIARRLYRSVPDCVHTGTAMERLAESASPTYLPGAVAGLLRNLPTRARQRLLETEPLSARLEATLAALHARLAHLDPNVHGIIQ
jgi:Lon protease-like protein